MGLTEHEGPVSIEAVGPGAYLIRAIEVRPPQGPDDEVTPHPFQLRPGSGNKCLLCDCVPGAAWHDPARWEESTDAV